MKFHKKPFPIKYLKKGLFEVDESLQLKRTKKKGSRKILKPKLSVHIKTGKYWGKIK